MASKYNYNSNVIDFKSGDFEEVIIQIRRMQECNEINVIHWDTF